MKIVFKFIVLLGFLTFMARPSCAVPVDLNRQVVLADGKPAAGAQVDVWIFDGTTTRVQEHKTLRLPADGWLRVQVDIPPSPADPVVDDHMGRRAIYNRHYFVVDFPGAPVAVVPIHEATPKLHGWDLPLKLDGGGIITGRAQSAGKPVAAANVAVMWLNGILLNSLDGAIKNPSLQAVADKDGNFVMRPLFLNHLGHPHDEPTPLAWLVARAKVDDSLQIGIARGISPVPVNMVGDARHMAFVHMGSTLAARGRVMDEISNKPVSGARVEIATDSVWPEATTTNARGEWEISGILPNRKMVAVATHPTTSVGWATVGEPGARQGAAESQQKVFEQVDIRVKPLATVTGRIVHADTGALPAPMPPQREIVGQVSVRYSWGEKIGNENIGGGLVRVPVSGDGGFSITLPVGEHDVRYSVQGHEAVEPQTLTVPATGLADITLKVRKRPVFFVQLTHPRLSEMKDLHIAIVTDKEFSNGISVKDGLWTHTAKQWGETLKIKVKRGSGRDITTILETTLTASPENWPQVLPLPEE